MSILPKFESYAPKPITPKWRYCILHNTVLYLNVADFGTFSTLFSNNYIEIGPTVPKLVKILYGIK